MKFSENLKRQRILNKVKQSELADLCNVTRSAVSNWENGRRFPQLSSVRLLANYFNITVDELLGSDKALIEYYMANASSLVDSPNIADETKPKISYIVPKIYALLTIVAVFSLLLTLIVPVVKDRYFIDENVNGKEVIPVENIQQVYLSLKYYGEEITVCLIENYSEEIKETKFIIDYLDLNALFENGLWGINDKVYVDLYIIDSNQKEIKILDESIYIKYNQTGKYFFDKNIVLSKKSIYYVEFCIYDNNYYLEVLPI